MAKVAKPRRPPQENPRSRTARRATSPSLNTDKSLKEAPRASDAASVLAPYRGAGIQKKSKKKEPSHAQKVRHEKGLQRGEATQDRLQTKLADAKSRLKRRQNRRALWEEVNTTSNEEVRKAIKIPGRFDSLNEDEELKDDLEAFEGDTEIKVIGGVQVPAFATGETMNVAVAPAFMTSTKKPGTFGTTKPVAQEPQPEPDSKEPAESMEDDKQPVNEVT